MQCSHELPYRHDRKALRRVTAQGSLLKVEPLVKRRKTGGGRRKPSNGFSENSSRSLGDYLLTREVPGFVVWPTFSFECSPARVADDLKAFCRRLENRTGPGFAAVGKLEPQPGTMLPELAVLVWGVRSLGPVCVAKAWADTIGRPAHVLVEPVDVERWERLALYVAKPFRLVGSFVHPRRLYATAGARRSFTCTTSQNRKLTFAAPPGTYLRPDPGLEEADERPVPLGMLPRPCALPSIARRIGYWRRFTGRCQFKYRPNRIPESPKEADYVSEEDVDLLRYELNRRRKRWFVGHLDGFKLRADLGWQARQYLQDNGYFR